LSAPTSTVRIVTGKPFIDLVHPEDVPAAIGFLDTQPALALQVFAETASADRDIAREERNAVVENVDVRDFVSDVDETDDAVHRIGVVELERVVERERVDVDDRRCDVGVGEETQLAFDQIALGRDEQHAHLETIGVRIENLKVELDRLHVEGDVLLRFPANELTRLCFLHTIDLNFLDDHVASADGGHDTLALDAGGGERGTNRVGDDARVHHFTFDDRVCEQGRDRDLHELRIAATVIDDCYLDETGADIESDCRLLATEERHVGGR